MERGKRDMNPKFLKIGLALAFSIGGMLYSFLRNKRIKPSQSPPDPSNSSDCNNQVISRITTNSRQFDPLATYKHEELHSSIPDLSPSNKPNADKDTYLLPEFNDLLKEFDITSMKTNTELSLSDAESSPKEIKSLRNTVKTLEEREQNLEFKLLEFYGLKEQETAVMELQNRLKLKNMEAKFFTLKIESLQTDNKRLEAKMADYMKVSTDLEVARAKIKVLKKKLRSEAAQNKEQILDLQKRVEKMQEDEEQKCVVGVDPEIEIKLRKLKDLEDEAGELRKLNCGLQVEKSELTRRLERVQMLATAVLEDEETEKLKEESQQLKKQNKDLTKEIEQLKADRCGDVEELVYLRWINACLRYELRNYQPAEPGKTMARDLSKTLSPKSEEKAKQLIIEYANKEGVTGKGINIHELDDDQWSSSQASNLTDSGELDGSFMDYSSPRKTSNKFFGKLVKFLRGKDIHSHSYSPNHHHNQRNHSRNSSIERPMSPGDELNSCSDSSFGNLGFSSKHSVDSQRSMHRYSDVGGHKRIHSIAEGSDIGGGGGCSDSHSSSDGQKSDLVKYADVLKDTRSNSATRFRRRSTPFSSF